MPTIITIGSQEFLLKSDAAGPIVFKALAGAIKLEWDYRNRASGRHYVRQGPAAIELKCVDASHIHNVETPEIVEPEPAPAPASPKRISGRPTLLLGNS